MINFPLPLIRFSESKVQIEAQKILNTKVGSSGGGALRLLGVLRKSDPFSRAVSIN